MEYRVISSGSNGNAVIYHDIIMVDCGVPYSNLKPFVKNIQLVLLTHEHSDHINIKTLRKLQKERPTLRIGCCSWMQDLIVGLNNIDVYEVGSVYEYGFFGVSPIKLYHDVTNCGYRITTNNYKIIHATDTSTLDGIEAKAYDLYAIESNYDEETINDLIAEKEAKGEFVYQKYAKNAHLSEQQVNDFYYNNKKESSILLRLHESKNK